MFGFLFKKYLANEKGKVLCVCGVGDRPNSGSIWDRELIGIRSFPVSYLYISKACAKTVSP